MIIVELHGKAPAYEGVEDILTASVFGVFRNRCSACPSPERSGFAGWVVDVLLALGVCMSSAVKM
jgi:hypothetical protein